MEQAETVLRGGVVWTGVADAEPVEALAVRGGKIVWVGRQGESEDLIGAETEVVELSGRAVVPGLIDSHTHFIPGGFQLSSVDLRDAQTPDEFTRRIADFARDLPDRAWITGGDWDHELWGGELPRKEWIDPVTVNHPVLVSRLDGHMALANTLALQAAGVTRNTSDPPGGTIVRDPDTGEPAGVLKDEAMGLVTAVIPSPSDDARDQALERAMRHALAHGVTQVHHMGTWEDLETFRRTHERGGLRVRIYSVVPIASWERLRDFVAREGRGDDWLWWGGLKGFVDGSLGSTTAWFYEPYDDEPGTAGLMTSDTARLRSWISEADRAGLHLMVHAIGDRANDWLLDVYEEVAADNGERDRRFRVEHAQHLTREAIDRFGRLKVIAAVQPYHAADDGRWAEKRIGPQRIQRTYAFRSLLDAGATLAFGSDWTVAPISPILGIDAAVTRRTIDGANPEGWVPQERITLTETLTAYTSGAATAGYVEEIVGTLEVGKHADLVVLSKDPFGMDPERVVELEVDLTMVGGEIEYRRESGT
jgi:predicted amidohydrolase YtcJ